MGSPLKTTNKMVLIRYKENKSNFNATWREIFVKSKPWWLVIAAKTAIYGSHKVTSVFSLGFLEDAKGTGGNSAICIILWMINGNITYVVWNQEHLFLMKLIIQVRIWSYVWFYSETKYNKEIESLNSQLDIKKAHIEKSSNNSFSSLSDMTWCTYVSM